MISVPPALGREKDGGVKQLCSEMDDKIGVAGSVVRCSGLASMRMDRLKVGRNKVSFSPAACLLFVVVQA